MRFYKDYTKEPFPLNDTTLPSDNLLKFRKKCYKMTLSKKIKAIDKNIEKKQSSRQF